MLGTLAAVCCDTENVGLEFNGGLQIGDSVADVQVTRMPTTQRRAAQPAPGATFLQRVEQAVQAAVHPDSAIGSGGGDMVNLNGGGSYASSAQVVPFPVVSPYRPLTATRVPIEGLTAFPKSGYYFNGEPVETFNNGGNDPSERLPPGHESLGFVDPMRSAPMGIGLDSADTYTPLGMQWEGVITSGIQTIPAIISSGKGTPYYDPSANVNPQLQGRPVYTEAPGGNVARTGAGADIGANAGAAVGNIGDTIGTIVAQHPYLVLGAGLAAVLLFMNPPRRR